MSSSSIQFHAAPGELLALVQWVAESAKARVMYTEFPPLKTVVLAVTDILKAFENEKFISFAFVVGAAGAPEGEYSPGDVINIEVERPKDNKLRQSTIGILSTKPEVQRAWTVVGRHVRAMTTYGVVRKVSAKKCKYESAGTMRCEIRARARSRAERGRSRSATSSRSVRSATRPCSSLQRWVRSATSNSPPRRCSTSSAWRGSRRACAAMTCLAHRAFDRL